MRWSLAGGGAVLAVALALALPAPAHAKYGYVRFSAIPGVSDPHYRPYTAILGGTNVCSTPNCTSSAGKTPVPLGFSFKFYGITYTNVTVGASGILTFDGNTYPGSADNPVPSSNDPKGVIAPFWWRSMQGDRVDYVTEGDPGSQRFTAQWQNFHTSNCQQAGSCNQYSWQVTLYEGSNAVEFRYQRVLPISGDDHLESPYSIGIESPADGTTGIDAGGDSCSPECALKDYPDGKVIRFVDGSDAAISQISYTNADQCATFGSGPCFFAGQPAAVTVSNVNAGGDSIAGITDQLYLTTDPNLQPSGNPICLSTDPSCIKLNPQSLPTSIAGSGSADTTTTVTIPADRQAGVYYLVGVADDGSLVPEADETNNTFVMPSPIVMRAGGTDLVVTAMSPPDTLPHITPTPIQVDIANNGFEPLQSFPLDIVLSANQVATTQDIVIFHSTDVLGGTPLAPGDSRRVTVNAVVPPEVPNDANLNNTSPNDAYYIAAIADPDQILSEVDELNNTFVSTTRAIVSGGAVTINDRSLPDAGLGSAYSVQMVAGGGAGSLHWVSSGGPDGLTIDGATGLYGGVAGQKGTFPVVFTATDDIGASDTKTIQLVVNPSLVPLRITTGELPYGSFGVPYLFGVGAVGGCAPYGWSRDTTDDSRRLPAGMTMGADGKIVGTPREAGAFPLHIKVADSCNGTAEIDTTLTVTEPPGITISITELPSASIGQTDYTAQLTAAGGRVNSSADYSWTLQQTLRLSEGPGDKGERWTPDPKDPTKPVPPPPGLTFSVTGEIKGTPQAAGSYLLTVQVTDLDNLPSSTTSGVVLLRVNFDTGMTITTIALPDAIVNQPYGGPVAEGTQGGVLLTASGGSGALQWTLLDADGLPKGLTLDPTLGVISGTPDTSSVTGGAQVYAFNVAVKDEANRTASRPLSIRVLSQAPKQPEPTKVHSGCGSQTAAGVPGALGLLLALALLRRRR